jgi:hypothetical protein
MLEQAPSSVADGDGRPRFGTFSGALGRVDLGELKGEFQLIRPLRTFKRKRWLYWFAATHEVAVLSAAVDVGYTANAFALAVDLKTGEVLHDSTVLGVPQSVSVSDEANEGLKVRYLDPRLMFKGSRDVGAPRFHLSVKAGLPLVGKRIDAELEMLAAGAPPPLSVVAPVSGGIVNVTQKWAGLLTFGALTANEKKYVLDGGVGGMDYTHGYLARRTAWRWGFACGRLEDGSPVGINLVEGFNDAQAGVNENALWVRGQLIPLSRARFSWNESDPLDKWRVVTDEGELDLTFKPLAMHREERNVVVAKSHFVQPVGLFEGTLKVGSEKLSVSALPGVTEEQDVTW